jgi:hypothetical protein
MVEKEENKEGSTGLEIMTSPKVGGQYSVHGGCRRKSGLVRGGWEVEVGRVKIKNCKVGWGCA